MSDTSTVSKMKKRHNKIKARIRHGIANHSEIEELQRIREVLGYKGVL